MNIVENLQKTIKELQEQRSLDAEEMGDLLKEILGLRHRVEELQESNMKLYNTNTQLHRALQDAEDASFDVPPKDVEHETTLALDKAKEIVCGDRARDYGKPSENHSRTAAMWAAYLGVPVTARDVCWLNILQKISRDRHRPVPDNPVDVAGYAQNAAWLGAE